MEDFNLKTEKLFGDLFSSIDRIEERIHNNSYKIAEDHYTNINLSLNQISKSLDHIEKKLEVSVFRKMKKTLALQMLIR